jgi:replicative DNA helicase
MPNNKRTWKKDQRLEMTAGPVQEPERMVRLIPQALGQEKSVLALMAMDPATYVGKSITMGVTEDFFYLPAHQLLWNLFQDRYSRNEPIDLVSISQVLEDRKQLDSVGGMAGLAEIYSYTTTGAYFDYHLEVLRDKYVLRNIIRISTESADKAYEAEDNVNELLDSVETDIFSIREKMNKGDEQSLLNMIEEAIIRQPNKWFKSW